VTILISLPHGPDSSPTSFSLDPSQSISLFLLPQGHLQAHLHNYTLHITRVPHDTCTLHKYLRPHLQTLRMHTPTHLQTRIQTPTDTLRIIIFVVTYILSKPGRANNHYYYQIEIILLFKLFIHSGHSSSASLSPLLLRSAPDTARILCRSFTPKRHRQL